MVSIATLELAIKRKLLTELIVETMNELPNRYIEVADATNIDLNSILDEMPEGSLLITNTNWKKEQKNFSILESSGDIVLSVSPDGELINNQTMEYWKDEYNLNYLYKQYSKVAECRELLTIALARV
jgi:hypothetical protein